MNIIPNAPLFRDPIYDGAADPAIIWNQAEQEWWIFYTSRRATAPACGVGYVHGTDIGIASSKDGGKSWVYRGIAQGLEFEHGRNTFWAPEIIEHEGMYHMYVSYIQGIPSDWDCPRTILHYTSTDLWDWKYESKLALSSDRVIDACVIQQRDGVWKMWYKDEKHESHTYTAVSKDLYHWTAGEAELVDCPHEGPNVFFFHEKYWMITDPWCGLDVYRSDDARHWEKNSNILFEPGIRKDDQTIGNHADVLVHRDRAYIFYFTHPEVTYEQRCEGMVDWEYKHRRSSLQVAELKEKDGILYCDRDHVEIDLE